jgi:hypothetical protein
MSRDRHLTVTVAAIGVKAGTTACPDCGGDGRGVTHKRWPATQFLSARPDQRTAQFFEHDQSVICCAQLGVRATPNLDRPGLHGCP